MGDQYQCIHLKEISIDFIKRRPISVLELVFKDHRARIEYKSNKFKQDDLLHWKLDMYIGIDTSATLTIWQPLFKRSFAEIEVEFKLNECGDDIAIGLEYNNQRVTVNFVCGRSKSLADITGALASQAHTALPLGVPRFLKLPQLAAPPPSTSERRYDGRVLYGAIHWLNDDILLDIFNCYRLNCIGWNVRLGWRKLFHVCQRWRYLIYESTFHLDMRIQCTNGTPILDTLDHLPPLPLLVIYENTRRTILTEQDELGIYHALRLHDRVCHIHLRNLPLSIFHKCLAHMDAHFPILENLALWFATNTFTTHALPKAFLAPNLRYLTLPGIGQPKRLRLLTSTVSLVTLRLWSIQASSYFRPRLLVARLSSLLQLEELSIQFSIPIPRPSAERELIGEQRTPVTLPNLKKLRFHGVSIYLESIVAQISVPLLKRLDITLFNQIAFALPHLSHLIHIMEPEGLKFSTVTVFFRGNKVSVTTPKHWSSWSFSLRVRCKQLDWQIDCAAQICGALFHARSGVEQFVLKFYNSKMPTKWQKGEIDVTTWHELLRSIIGMERLHIDDGLLEELSRALQVDEVGLDPGFLPNLQYIVASANLFASFINTRRVVDRPVRFSPPQVPRPATTPGSSSAWSSTE